MANSQIQDNMRIDWDVAIKMDDGLILRADVFRPIQEAVWAKYGVEVSPVLS